MATSRIVGDLTDADREALLGGTASADEIQTRVDSRRDLETKSGASNPNAATKVPSESKSNKNSVVDPPPEELSVVQKVLQTDLIKKRAVIENAENYVPADYYRRGGPIVEKEIDGIRERFQEIRPRTLEEPSTEEPASIRLIGKPGNNPKAKDVDLIPAFTKFFLESVQEGHSERHQIVETFGDFYVFFFGERPPIYTYSGTLINSNNINWVEDMLFYYDNFLRGTKCVEANAKMVLTYGHRQVEGFLLGINLSTQAASDKGVQVSFNVLIVDRKVMKLSMDFGLIEANGKFAEDASIIQMLEKGYSDGVVSGAVNSVKSVASGKKGATNTSKVSATNIDSMKSKFKSIDLVSTPSGGVSQKFPFTRGLPPA